MVYTVKPVYNDHSRDQVIVVSVDRWSLYGGTLIQLKWTIDQLTVASIDRWSLNASGLYCKTGSTVPTYVRRCNLFFVNRVAYCTNDMCFFWMIGNS